MKKNLFFALLILFVLSTTAFAGFTDSKNASDKPALSNTRENKLSDEELSRMTRKTETDNLSKANLINNESKDSKNTLKARQIIVSENRHGGYVWLGGGGLLLIIILVVILV